MFESVIHRRGLAAVLAGVICATLVAGAVLAHHGGRDITAQFNCNRPVVPPRCTSVGDNPRHLVYFDSSLTDALAVALRATMAEDYGATKLVVIEQSRATRVTDVIAFSGDYGENGAAGWVYCPSDAPQGTNPSGDRWCRHQELHLNLNPRYAAFFDDEASRNHVTCHEMGHTVGLRHWGNPPQTSGTDVGATCMNANTPNGPTTLHQFDIDHINAYHYRQGPMPGHRPLTAPTQSDQRRLLPWAGTLDADEVEDAGSFEALVTDSDAVVRGRVTGVSPGREFGGLHYAAATLVVDELLVGSVPTGRRLTLEIPLFDGPSSIDRLPDWGEAIFFLRNKATSARLAGLAAHVEALERPFYRLMSFGSIVVDDRGTAVVDADAPLLAGFAGMPFEQVAVEVRAAAR